MECVQCFVKDYFRSSLNTTISPSNTLFQIAHYLVHNEAKTTLLMCSCNRIGKGMSMDKCHHAL